MEEINTGKGKVTSQNTDKRLEAQIQDIMEAISATEAFIAGMNFAEFSRDQKTIFAIERSLGIVGTAAKRLPVTLMDKYSQFNWRHTIGLGDKLTFGIFEVDLDDLWAFIQNDMPEFKILLRKVLSELTTANNPEESSEQTCHY